MIVSPESAAVTPLSTSKTRLALLPLMLSKPAPGPSIVIAVPVLLGSSCPCVSVIVAGMLPS